MDKNARIYVAGHRGLVGSAIFRALKGAGYTNLVGRTHAELDLEDTVAVRTFFAAEKPEYVIDAAAKVGGIMANNTYPAEFIYENLAIQNNIIHQAYRAKVKRLLFLGSSCVYPRTCPQPIQEEYLLTSELEETNKPYAVAKIAGIVMCESYNRQYGTDFISVMPANVYGPNDNFDPQTSHMLPALIRKFVEAKAKNAPTVTLWGSGTPRRELLYIDDLADACLFVMNQEAPPRRLNIGTGADSSIQEIAGIVKAETGFAGAVEWDRSKPDGTPQKLLDVSGLHSLGWRHSIDLREGIRRTVEYFKTNVARTT